MGRSGNVALEQTENVRHYIDNRKNKNNRKKKDSTNEI